MTPTLRPVGAAILLLSLALPTATLAAEPEFSPSDVPTVFFINKSDDHNRVDYGMRLNAECVPVGREPVFPYWREFEHSPPVRTHALGVFEYFAYGVKDQRLVRRTPTGAEWQIRLKRLERPIVITTGKGPSGSCTAKARTTIGGVAEAELRSVYAKLKGLMSVAYLDVFGTRPGTGEAVEERLRP